MRFTLDRRSARPLHRQLDDELRAWINRQRPGTRLPSTRNLASELSVSRNTVIAAYDELKADGLIEARIGSGTRIIANPAHGPTPLPDWREAIRKSHYPAETAWLTGPNNIPILLFRSPRV